jgi:hypothetical protein
MATTESTKKPVAKKAAAKPSTKTDAVIKPDPLSRDEMAAQYQSAIGLIYSVPEITDIFEKAVREQWVGQSGIDKFNAAIQNSDWYKNNNQYFRKAWAAENFGKTDGQTSADWQASLQNAQLAIQNMATKIGTRQYTPAELDALARRYLYEGWGEAGREQLMVNAMSGDIGGLPDERGNVKLTGAAGNLADDLRKIAQANGINYSESWFQAAAKSVASNLTTADDWERDIREQAAGRWGVFGDKIRAGANAYDLASPYINLMAEEFDMSPDQINLNDRYIRSALSGYDDKGNPVAKSLWDFQKELRSDPRWMETKGALDQVSSTANTILKMFGFR